MTPNPPSETPTPKSILLHEFDRLFCYLDHARPDAPRNSIDPYQIEGGDQFGDLRTIRDALTASQNKEAELRKELDATALFETDSSGIIKIVELPEISRVSASVIRQMVAEHNELIDVRKELARVSAELEQFKTDEPKKRAEVGYLNTLIFKTFDAGGFSGRGEVINDLPKLVAKLSASAAAMRTQFERIIRANDSVNTVIYAQVGLQPDAGRDYIPRDSAIKREVVEWLGHELATFQNHHKDMAAAHQLAPWFRKLEVDKVLEATEAELKRTEAR